MVNATIQFKVCPPRGALSRRRRVAASGYTLIEMLLVVLILQIISAMVVVRVSAVTTQQELAAAAQQVVNAARYARMLAMSTGQTSGVQFDLTNQTITCYDNGSYAAAPCAMFGSNTYVLDLPTYTGLGGTTIKDVENCPATGQQYDCSYGPLGSLANADSDSLPVLVTLSLNGETRVVTIPALGEPTF